MYKGIIFDLDQTLVDSSIAEQHRKQRNWINVYSLIPSFTLYDGIEEVFKHIRSNNIKVCIVTTSPEPYVKKVITHFQIPCNALVDFFLVKPIKPHPEQMNKALELLNMKKEDVVSFGDRVIDIQASNAAGIASVACLWGSKERDALINCNPTHIISHPIEILKYI